MSATGRFKVDTRLARLLGESYRSSEHALKELVDNAWDADATAVDVHIPEPPSMDPVVISDNGTGMTVREVRAEYLWVARDRRDRRGRHTVRLKRLVKGRKGIGKFAGLAIAETMEVVTSARGKRTTLRVSRTQLRDAAGDLEKVQLPLQHDDCASTVHGTVVTLESLDSTLTYPSEKRLRALLMREYGRAVDFKVSVNGVPLAVADLPGHTEHHVEDVPSLGTLTVSYTFTEQPQPKALAGVSLRVGGKIVGPPTFFGLEEEPEIPEKILRRLYGELDADALEPDVTADWGAITENSKTWQAVCEWARNRLRHDIVRLYAKEVALAKARNQREINRRLESLPEYRRQAAERAIERVLRKFYDESQDRVEVVVGLTLDAFEHDEYWEVFRRIDDAPRRDVALLADALRDFGLVDMALVTHQARQRLRLLDEFETLITDAETLEAPVHAVVAANLWLLGSNYRLLSSNQTLANVVEKYLGSKFTGKRASKRPDLFLSVDYRETYLLIEFKRPNHPISRNDENQAQKYRDDLVPKFGPISILLLGESRSKTVQTGMDPPNLFVQSYADLVSRARSELNWLLNDLRERQL